MSTARGFTLLEVLIALVLVSIALLGLAGLQARAQHAELEAYQRSQALLLINDITSRINLNRQARRCYVTEDAQNNAYSLGVGTDNFPNCVGFGNNETRTLADADMQAWDDLLDGASESQSGQEIGALVGARGCIDFDPANNTITVTVAWQGEVPTTAPPADVTCGEDQYGDEKLRRTLTETIAFADLGA